MTNLFNVAKESHTIPTLTVPTDAPATEPSPDEESSGVAATMAPADHARSDTRPAAATSAPLPADATAPDADPDTAPDPRIRIYHGRYVDYHDQRLETWDALIGANSRGEAAPVFYRRDGMMVTVHDADDGLPLIQRVSQHLMENYLADIISWRTLTRDGTEKPVPPPPRLARSMPTTPDSRLPVLAGVISRPFLAADRSAVRAHGGYHAPERVLMRCDVAVDTSMDATQALGHIRGLFQGFPFAGPSDWANFLACLITPLLGMAVDKTPFFLVDKPKARTGATLLVNTVAAIHTGQPQATLCRLGRDADETAKELSAAGGLSHGIVLFDNLSGRVDNPQFAAYLTAEIFMQRRLGTNYSQHIVDRHPLTEIGTANHLTLSDELALRCVGIRLDANAPDPQNRLFTFHPVISALQRRSLLLSAVVSLVQRWLDAGSPPAPAISGLGGFEEWRDLTAAILHHIGIPDFLAAQAEFVDRSRSAVDQSDTFIQVWWDALGNAMVVPRDLLSLALPADHSDPLGIDASSARGRTGNLAKSLGGISDQVFRVRDGDRTILVKVLRRAAAKGHPPHFRLAEVETTRDGGDTGDTGDMSRTRAPA